MKKSWLSYIAAAGPCWRRRGVSLAWVDDARATSRASSSIDDYTTFFRVLLHGDGGCRLPRLGASSSRSKLRHPGEYYALIILSTIGAIGMAASRELMTAYLSLELLSFSLYILVSYAEVRPALERGRPEVPAARRVRLGDVPLRHEPDLRRHRHRRTTARSPTALAQGTDDFEWALLMGLVLMIAGLGFKVAAVPFHMWTPDAYEGAPVADHGVPLDDLEGGGVRAAAAAVRRRVPGRARRLELDDRRHRRGDDGPRQPRRAAAAQHQAADGVLVDRAGRLHADGHRRRCRTTRRRRWCCT